VRLCSTTAHPTSQEDKGANGMNNKSDTNQALTCDDLMFLAAIRKDTEKRKAVISILKEAGLLPLSSHQQH
jgi:hypothetical protein